MRIYTLYPSVRDTIYKETQKTVKFLKIYSDIAKDVTFRKSENQLSFKI